MGRALLIIALSTIFLLMQLTNVDRNRNTSLINSLTFSLQYAAHDAALQVDPLQQAEGYIVFNREEARNVFEETLRRNLRLKMDLTPLPNTLLDDPVEILFEDFVDDSSGVTFPYNYVNDQYHIYKTLLGPAVIYEVRVKSTRSSKYSFDGYIYKNIIELYPFPN
ncbi:hypothetical protein [Bacillus sp. FJAT-28004]|uniref:hypothetical protein n=1 Tax=Bacillus sp. FJAT-28004 TaxID=1679165 RepID=UPI0006B586EB|nr:hypothetical protein [Bacillus sp. FJAT-28004]